MSSVFTHVASEETLTRVKNAIQGNPTGKLPTPSGFTHVASEETLEEIADILEARIGLIWDAENMRYTNESVHALVASRKDGQAYGVSIPKGSATACTKTGAHAAVAAPTPGIVGRPAIDPYVGLGPFWFAEVNGYVDEDGMPFVTAIAGDGRFRRDGSNGNVWILAPVLDWLMNESDEDAVTLSISDTRLAGMEAQPQAYLPDGTLRPYMLYAKYVGTDDGDGMMASVSGKAPWNYNVSHNSLITQCKTASTGYSGKSIADDWYLKVMFLLKYATKHSQSVFAGCTNYNYQYNPAVAETGVTRVILTKAQAANLIVGSSMMLGTHAGTNPGKDRNTGVNHDVFSNCRILKIEDYDSDNSAVYLDSADTFDVGTGYLFSTAPWFSGVLDAVEGDGTLTEAGQLNGHEPFKIQGIETMMGLFECLGDVILNGDATLGWEACVNYDSRNEDTSLTANYSHTGKYLEASKSAAQHYPLYPSNAGGLLLGQGTGASQTTGMADSQYTSGLGTGAHEWLGMGSLNNAGVAGLWFVSGFNALTSGVWSFGSRLSGTGRGRAVA